MNQPLLSDGWNGINKVYQLIGHDTSLRLNCLCTQQKKSNLVEFHTLYSMLIYKFVVENLTLKQKKLEHFRKTSKTTLGSLNTLILCCVDLEVINLCLLTTEGNTWGQDGSQKNDHLFQVSTQKYTYCNNSFDMQ